jgi:alpha-ketoglutarate-dependent taurine dioxygenase
LLADWVAKNRAWADAQLVEHGAVLIRGFDVGDAPAVEKLAAAFIPELEHDYLGTSPRNALTPRVFNASELPGYYPIPQHCEMTYVARPPRRIFFCCLVPPREGTGQTPITDFAKVAAQLDSAVKERLVRKRLRLIRNYGGPSSAGKRDLWQLKRWDEMFATTDRAVVEARCKAEGFDCEWTGVDGLRLVSEHDPIVAHPQTGVDVWFNHLQVFHLAAGPAELRRALRHRFSLKQTFFLGLASVLAAQKRRKPDMEQAMHMTHADGTPVSDADVEHVLDVIWKNQVVFSWQKGDFVAIDNRRIAHGRLPYSGPRQVVVAWS